jgi:hypothetical protein
VEEHMPLIDTKTRERIRELNDALRTTFDPKLGKAMLTSGVNSLPSDVRAMAIRKTVTFAASTCHRVESAVQSAAAIRL